jgi:hypothetical protein
MQLGRLPLYQLSYSRVPRRYHEAMLICMRLGPMRTWLLAVIAAGLGLAIALVDARPTWDDTGITAGVVPLTAFILAALAGRRPWLWALLVGVWVLAITIVNGGDPAAFLALAFALAGAYAGYAASRLSRRTAAAAAPPSGAEAPR